MQDAGEPALGSHSPAAGYADLKTLGVIEVPVVPERSVRAAGADIKLTETRAITP